MSDNGVILVDHPLIRHKLTLMRQSDTPTNLFRWLLREIAGLLAYEVLRDAKLETVTIQTPLETMEAQRLAGPKLCFVSILRAGNGLLDGMLDMVPSARVGYIGLYRDEVTLQPVQYYKKLPDRLEERITIVVDPMLATGGSAAAAISRIKEDGARDIRFACLLAAPEGIKTLKAAHPEVPIYTTAVDRQLNELGFILPGLGDAGDRIYGTR
ncbi:MAG TPA: uracil phosphoribosyltransferase [Alphaproteobacteria bacterium]|nr:uracil phosphoribosyltransferase [Alphaproteobacteria bacterium]